MSLLTAREEEEYNILKECFSYNETAGNLEAKYPISKGPSVLVNYLKETKTCQALQERRQLKGGTHSQYVEQLRDMLNRNVIFLLTHSELDI